MNIRRGNLASLLPAVGISLNHILFFNFLIKCQSKNLRFTVSRNRLGLPCLTEFKDSHGSSIPYTSCYRVVSHYLKRGGVIRDVGFERDISSPVQIFRPNPILVEFITFLFEMINNYYKYTGGDEHG